MKGGYDIITPTKQKAYSYMLPYPKICIYSEKQLETLLHQVNRALGVWKMEEMKRFQLVSLPNTTCLIFELSVSEQGFANLSSSKQRTKINIIKMSAASLSQDGSL